MNKNRVPSIALAVALALGNTALSQDSRQLPLPSSPGKAIQDAAQSSAQYRPKTGPLEILSDTQGVNFHSYLEDVLFKVRRNWWSRIPESDTRKNGTLAIEFSISKGGEIGNIKLASSAGDVSLDRAAWGAVFASGPFPALPSAYTNQLRLRLHFYYNPSKGDLVHDGISVAEPIVHAVLIQSVFDSNPPKYPKDAYKEKIEGMVRLRALIGIDGKIKSIDSLEGRPILEDAASKAVRKWRFQPAQLRGKPAEDHVVVKVEFRLDGEQVRAMVVSPQSVAPGYGTE